VVENPSPSGVGIYINNQSGSGNNYEIHLEGNQVIDCPYWGTTFYNGSGSIENCEISLKDNALLGNGAGCVLQSGGPIEDFSAMMEGNDVVGGEYYGVVFYDPYELTASSIIDLGGGELGSAGHNRILIIPFMMFGL